MVRKIIRTPIKLPHSIASTPQPNPPPRNTVYISGQTSAIRFFNPDSKSDYKSMLQIVGHQAVRNWMDDSGKITLSDYRFWAGEHTHDSFLFAVHDARAATADLKKVCGFVYIYSEHAEKFRAKRLIKLGLIKPHSAKTKILEASMALRPLSKGSVSGSGLMSSALRQSCLEVRSLLNYPRFSDLIITAFIDPNNTSSARAFEAAGFVKKSLVKYDPDSPEQQYLYILNWSVLLKKVKNNFRKINLFLEAQITDSHCGPAVTQGLLAFNRVRVTQNQIVDAAKVKTTIVKHGMRPNQIALAAKRLSPNLVCLFKQHATIRDLDILINKFGLPVAVNWQGLFYDTVKEEKRLSTIDDHGHYSIIVDIDPQKDEISVADPYSEYAKTPRIFYYKWFKTRWWDSDKIFNRLLKSYDEVHTKKLIFVIVPKTLVLPSSLKLQPQP